MQQLADEVQISAGNLTYHFPKKEDLMIAIYDLFRSEIAEIVPSEHSNQHSLFQLDDQIRAFYDVQQRFLFFYLDLLEIERSYDSIAEQHYDHIKQQISAIKSGLDFNVDDGFLKKDGDNSTYFWLAQQLWFSAVFWPQQIRVRGIGDHPENMRKLLWYQIKPFLTVKGYALLESILEVKVLNR